MVNYDDTQTRIVIWTLAGTMFSLFIALLSCICSNIRRFNFHHVYNPVQTESINSIQQTYYDSFRQFQDFVINVDEIKMGKELGKGSFGDVYIGTFRGSQVAVKKMTIPLYLKEGSETFVTEVLTLSSLRNRNIVQFMGICIDKDVPCIVMEYMKGGSVATVIHKEMRQLNMKTLLKWALDAAIGMEFLHSHKPHPIIHRDIKSDNLLVDENGLVKVGDFGTAKLMGKITKYRRQVSRKKKKKDESHEAFPGTTAWAAPEVLPPKPPKRAQKYTTAADVYSYGVTLWEMVSNKRPFKGYRFEYKIMDDVLAGHRPVIPSSCSRGLAQLIEECWHPDLTKRPSFPDIHGIIDRMIRQINVDVLIRGGSKRGGSLPTKLKTEQQLSQFI